nr:ATPase family AAA domain-containing protein 2-like [Leptinotarsa decemlineata]
MSLLNQNKESKTLRKERSSKDLVDFTKVGGLANHLKTLREVIIFPLLHGNVFSHFKIKPPRGVLFYGPPGTGKTLVAGALAAEINKEGIGKVTFFQRKGADVLDKWVGESEKNLRALFDKATKSRPSIIFFDELDGLAPTRSEKNDHIHSSVVATLLSLMDGLDSKPGVIVIGATNRIEAIDPALRRAGRFDKELYFPLPGVEARKEIIQVHTNTWKHKPSPTFIAELADMTAGFCGADIQALCSEAVLCCLRRSYPKIESKGFRMTIDADLLKVEECDFLDARANLVPSSTKQGQKMRNLTRTIRPLLKRQQNRIMKYIQLLWPHFLQEGFRYMVGERRYSGRIILVGTNMQGLHTHLIPAILKNLEHMPVNVYDTRIFDRIKSNTINLKLTFPAIIFLSRIDEWWNNIDDCDQHSIVSTLEDIHAGLPILTIACCKSDIPGRLHNFFYNNSTILIRIEDPNEEERENFLAPLFFDEKSLSLYTIWQESRKAENKIIKYEPPEPCKAITRKRKRKEKVKNLDNMGLGDISKSIEALDQAKRKREQSNHDLVKKIKLCESKFGTYKSNSISSLYDLHRQMKREKGDEGNLTPGDSMTSVASSKNKQYFTRVLSDLLNHRNIIVNRDSSSSSTNILENVLCDKLIKIEPRRVTTASSYRQKFEDIYMEKIYNLWKHASMVTSKNMAVAQLELLYDVISACISINRNSFSTLLEHLENVLRRVETSHHDTDSDEHCS